MLSTAEHLLSMTGFNAKPNADEQKQHAESMDRVIAKGN